MKCISRKAIKGNQLNSYSIRCYFPALAQSHTTHTNHKFETINKTITK